MHFTLQPIGFNLRDPDAADDDDVITKVWVSLHIIAWSSCLIYQLSQPQP